MQDFDLRMSHLLFLKLLYQLRRLAIEVLRLLQYPAELQRDLPLQLSLVRIVLVRAKRKRANGLEQVSRTNPREF